MKIRESFHNLIKINTGNFNLSYFELKNEEDGNKILNEVYEPIQNLLFIFKNDFAGCDGDINPNLIRQRS